MPSKRLAPTTVLQIATQAQRRKRTASSYKEFAEQVEFAKRCDLHPDVRSLCYTASMQGVNLGVRAATQAKAKGVKKGVPDWLLFHNGWGHRPEGSEYLGPLRCYGLALEFKSPDGTGKVSSEQDRWAAGLRAMGWRVEFPTSATEAWMILADYLRLTR